MAHAFDPFCALKGLRARLIGPPAKVPGSSPALVRLQSIMFDSKRRFRPARTDLAHVASVDLPWNTQIEAYPDRGSSRPLSDFVPPTAEHVLWPVRDEPVRVLPALRDEPPDTRLKQQANLRSRSSGSIQPYRGWNESWKRGRNHRGSRSEQQFDHDLDGRGGELQDRAIRKLSAQGPARPGSAVGNEP